MTELHQPTDPPKRDLEVRFLRLNTGEDIIGFCLRLYVEEEGIDGWFVRDPIVVIMEVDPDLQKQTCIMMPWLPRGIVASNDCIIETKEVVLVLKVEPDVEEYYRKLSREAFNQKPKIFSASKTKTEEKNVFGFDMKRVRPVKGIQNEKQEEKANT